MNFIKDCITFFQAGGVFMYPLAACSVLLIAAIIYRMFNMKRSTICPARLTRAVEQYTRGALERSELERMAGDSDSVEGRLVLDALNSPLEDEAALKEMIHVKARDEFVTLQAGLPLLELRPRTASLEEVFLDLTDDNDTVAARAAALFQTSVETAEKEAVGDESDL